MSKYEELVYSLIYNCNREITKEEKKILNQASAIYNTYNNLTDALGCPLEVVFKALKQDYFYTKSGKHSRLEFGVYGGVWCICYGLRTQIRVDGYKKTWWLKEDRSE